MNLATLTTAVGFLLSLFVSSDSCLLTSLELVSRTEWNALVEYDQAELTGPSYQISLYLDPIDLSFSSKSQKPENLAGAAAIFAGGMDHSSVKMPNGKVTQTVPLTPKLLEKTDDLTAALVGPLLTSQLSWSVERVCEDTGDFLPVDVNEIKSLKISVVSSKAEYASDFSQLPSKMDELLHLDPTDGKLGGLSNGDEIPAILKGVKGVLDLVGDAICDVVGGLEDAVDDLTS